MGDAYDLGVEWLVGQVCELLCIVQHEVLLSVGEVVPVMLSGGLEVGLLLLLGDAK